MVTREAYLQWQEIISADNIMKTFIRRLNFKLSSQKIMNVTFLTELTK